MVAGGKISKKVRQLHQFVRLTVMGDWPEENAAVAKERARADARRAASEQVGLYVAGMTEVKKGKLTRDEIRTGLQQGHRT